jgi:uncharacterized peroxidase-related enzyme
MSFPVHSPESAPQGAKSTLTEVQRTNGFIPNLYGVMAEAPSVLKGYLALGALFADSSLSATEQQVVALTVSAVNHCTYCVAAHTVIAGMQQVPGDVVTAIREGMVIGDSRLEALRVFTAAVVTERGHPSAAQAAAFRAAGYEDAQVLEVVLGVGMKTLSNYVNHLAGVPLDAAFTKAQWMAGVAV